NNRVQTARHALALDEMRASFTPTLWSGVDAEGKPHNDLEQVWFAGVHSDVGGGYLQTGLSDQALDWMIVQAGGKGLKFNEDLRKKWVHARPDDVLHDSRRGAMKHLPTRP